MPQRSIRKVREKAKAPSRANGKTRADRSGPAPGDPAWKLAALPVRPPLFRRLRVFAFDPGLATQLENAAFNVATIKVPWEKVEPGPAGEYLEVLDIDPASGCCYAPLDLNDKYLLAQDGLDPSEGNPAFHQQMVYAVAMTTIRT